MALQSEILRQIDAVLAKHSELRSRSKYDDCSDRPSIDVTALTTLMCETISRLAPTNSQYVESMKTIIRQFGVNNAYVVPHIAGVLTALRTAYDADYVASVTELIHGDIFADFVEMAEYLLSEGYKDAAAVIIGSTLEEHLRQLCIKNGIATGAAERPKRADQLNADLAGPRSIRSLIKSRSRPGLI